MPDDKIKEQKEGLEKLKFTISFLSAYVAYQERAIHAAENPPVEEAETKPE
jgi:hypothetical protein